MMDQLSGFHGFRCILGEQTLKFGLMLQTKMFDFFDGKGHDCNSGFCGLL